jgi:hypothetical protein
LDTHRSSVQPVLAGGGTSRTYVAFFPLLRVTSKVVGPMGKADPFAETHVVKNRLLTVPMIFLPASMLPGSRLKRHQRSGMHWQRNRADWMSEAAMLSPL